MFGELDLPTFNVEVMLPGFLLRGEFEPKGDMQIYLNDHRYTVIRLNQAALYPTRPKAQIRGVKQPMIAASKTAVMAVSILEEADLEHITLLNAKRPFVVYTESYAIRGNLHINADARNDDVFDETKDFFAISQAAVYPIYASRQYPVAKVPLLLINQRQVYAYHPYQEQSHASRED
jgi:hypothetical protein